MKKNYFKDYLSVAPLYLALVRAIECRLLSKVEFKSPMLDVGCGDGLFASKFFTKKIECGVDISEKEVATARKKGIYEDIKVDDIQKSSLESDQFATVFSNCVLEHIPDIDSALSEISRVLKKEGRLIFTVPANTLGKRLFYSTLFRRIGLNGMSLKYDNFFNKVCTHNNLFTPEEWEKRLEKAGLEVVSCTRYLSDSATKIHDISITTLGIPALFKKRIFGKMYLFPWFRKNIEAPIISKIFYKQYIKDDFKNGSTLLIIAEKKK